MRVYVHGNCQAPALADLIGQACGGAMDVVSRQVYSIDLEAEGAAHIHDVETADVILTQPVADGYRGTDILSTSWMRARARKDAIFLVFPVIYHRGLQPQCYTLGDFHAGRLAYHDAHALDYFLMGEDADSFVRATNRSDFLPESFVLSELSRTTLELLRRERALAVDLPVSDIIATRLSSGQPMYTVNHPSRAVMVDLADRVLERLGRPERASPDGIDMLDLFIMPPYLSTALALGHSGSGIWLDDMSADGVMESRLDFFRHVFQSYQEIGRDRLRRAVAENPEITGYLARYEHARMQGASRDMSDLIDALYETFLDRPAAPDEILHHLQTVRLSGFSMMVSAFAGSPEFHARGGAASMMNRFPKTHAMPVRRPHVRIPHPGQLVPTVASDRLASDPQSLKARLQRIWRAVINSPPEP
ncbi:MAG TPA: WcbI family polysaccharide biosynthesis putative acetyltransferase, partial [Brevundimonas sp.]